jgi:hypothetical protein
MNYFEHLASLVRESPTAATSSRGVHGFARRTLPCAAKPGGETCSSLICFNEVDKRGDFAAWEQPEHFRG